MRIFILQSLLILPQGLVCGLGLRTWTFSFFYFSCILYCSLFLLAGRHADIGIGWRVWLLVT